MGRLEEYEQFLTKYIEIYGNRTVVLYQMGKFHEIYGVDNDKEKVGNVAEIAALLGIKETRVNTSILDNNRQNPQMAGFNSVNLDERVDKLVNYGYTVVVVNQIPGTKPLQRAVAYIESPSTRISNEPSGDPFLVSIYLDRAYNRSASRYYSYIGMAAMDTTTGESSFYESNSTVSDPTLAEDDLTRFLQSFNPVEIVLNRSARVRDSQPGTAQGTAQGAGIESDSLDSQVHKWGFRLKNESWGTGIGLKPTVFTDTGDQVTKLSYQEEFLGRYFTNRGHLDPSEFLGMAQYDMARIAYIYLLDFCSNHNARILTGLSPPKLWNTGNTMVLDTSSIVQLNIIESYYDRNRQDQDSVVSMLSKYVRTAMGRRLLRDRLINPITDPVELRNRYDKITNSADLETKHKSFSKIRDLDRLNRKMALGTLTPAELYILNETLNIAYSCTDVLADIPDIQSAYLDIVNIEEAGKCTVTDNMQDSIFKLGYNADIDQLSSQIRNVNRVRDILCQKLSDLIAPGSSYCKYKEDLTGQNCYCSVTKAQFKKLESNFPAKGLVFVVAGKEYQVPWTELDLDTRNKSNVKFSIVLLDNLLRQQSEDIDSLRQLSIKLYTELLIRLQTVIGERLKAVSSAIGELDLNCGMYRCAISNNYCKPELIEADCSCLNAVRLRHPLVERDHAYIPQNLQLGKDGQLGILLYGVNQTGKSCTMKSVGVATIMAQAGLFVPAEQFKLCPYQLLTTRILGNDNISRGLSTFAVEMLELRSILTRCNSHTLSLGDEVCHGTESASAVALVAASILHMAKQGTSFIFATHLHELSKMEEITSLDTVKHYHLTIDFDGDKIIYNRVMLPGSGLGLYGIEVAKHLKLPSNVLENAYQIRNKYFSTGTDAAKLSELKESRYNHKKVMSVCKVPDCTQTATQTHHIRHQAAGKSIEGMNVNNPDNLVPICDYHHDMTHGKAGDQILVIFGYGADQTLDCKVRKKVTSLL